MRCARFLLILVLITITAQVSSTELSKHHHRHHRHHRHHAHDQIDRADTNGLVTDEAGYVIPEFVEQSSSQTPEEGASSSTSTSSSGNTSPHSGTGTIQKTTMNTGATTVTSVNQASRTIGVKVLDDAHSEADHEMSVGEGPDGTLEGGVAGSRMREQYRAWRQQYKYRHVRTPYSYQYKYPYAPGYVSADKYRPPPAAFAMPIGWYGPFRDEYGRPLAMQQAPYERIGRPQLPHYSLQPNTAYNERRLPFPFSMWASQRLAAQRYGKRRATQDFSVMGNKALAFETGFVPTFNPTGALMGPGGLLPSVPGITPTGSAQTTNPDPNASSSGDNSAPSS